MKQPRCVYSRLLVMETLIQIYGSDDDQYYYHFMLLLLLIILLLMNGF